LRHVGLGPFPLPGERRRERRALADARDLLAKVAKISSPDAPPDHCPDAEDREA
jgi:hypothetical protein